MSIDLDDLNDTLGAFESAVSSTKVAISISEPDISAIALALDGTSKDDTAIALAGEVATHFGARVIVTTWVKDGIASAIQTKIDSALKTLAAAPFNLAVESAFTDAKTPAKQILKLREEKKAGLIVVPSPYLYEYEGVGDESLSEAVDCMIAESHVPLLLVREPMANVKACLDRMLIPMTVHSAGLGVAAGWAFRLAEKGGHIDLFAVADQKALEEADAVLGVDGANEKRSPEALLRAEQTQIGGMVSALQHHGSERKLKVHVDVVVARSLKPVLDRIHASPCVVCMPIPRDRTGGAFHRAQDIALGSHHPVLLTPF